MSRLNDYLEMAKRSMHSISQNLQSDTVEGAVNDFIKKAKQSRYGDDEIIRGMMDAFGITRKQAAYQLKRYQG